MAGVIFLSASNRAAQLNHLAQQQPAPSSTEGGSSRGSEVPRPPVQAEAGLRVRDPLNPLADAEGNVILASVWMETEAASIIAARAAYGDKIRLANNPMNRDG